MAFWGVELKPSKPYIHRYDDERGRLHVSQATLGAGSSTKKSVVQCKVGNRKPIFLCSLLPERLETCALNLEFDEEDEVTFSVVGPLSVHLSGFFYTEQTDQDCHGDDYESDSYEEDIMVTESDDDSGSLGFESEDGDEAYDFVDGDTGIFLPPAAQNTGVRIEEIIDDEKPTEEDSRSKQYNKKEEKLTEPVNDENPNQEIVAKAGAAVVLAESEDEDGFPISACDKTSCSKYELKSVECNDKINSDKLQKKGEKDVTCEKNLKRKVNVVDQDDELASESTEACNPTQFEDKVKKRKKKKKVAKKLEAPEAEKPKICCKEESLVAENGNDLEKSVENIDRKQEKKKKKKDNHQEASQRPKSDEKSTAVTGSSLEKQDTKEPKPLQVRSFPNGLVVEEILMGKPDGKKAAPGKKVSVYYIGKLKKNGKIFDSNIGRAPFKFRLGIGQVIKGWDVGVNGMRVGDKRRLTIPPAMGYGAKGCSPAIPPNAWLVFDVELVDANRHVNGSGPDPTRQLITITRTRPGPGPDFLGPDGSGSFAGPDPNFFF